MRYGEFEKLPQGTSVSRYIKLLGQYNGDYASAAHAAENNKAYDTTPSVSMSLKAGAACISNPLTPSGMMREVFELFLSRSIFGPLRDRFAPGVFAKFLVPTLIVSDEPIKAAWVCEGSPSPVCVVPVFDEHRHRLTKVSFIVIFPDEILRDATLASGKIVSRILSKTTAAAVDGHFLSDEPETDNQPGGIFHGSPSVVMSGLTREEITVALASMAEKLSTWRDPVWFMHTALFARLSLLGMIDFTGDRGRLCGFDIVQSTCTDKIILCDVGSVLLADDGVSTIDYANSADIFAEIGGETKRVSLFQDGMSGFKITRTINWYRPKESSVVSCSFPPEAVPDEPGDDA